MSDITRILQSIDKGGAERADELLTLVYEQLRHLAANKLAREKPGQTLQATALVHEAWLRLGGDKACQWQGRAHFFAAAAEAMRRILIDQARRKRAIRHGGGHQWVNLDDVEVAVDTPDEQLLGI